MNKDILFPKEEIFLLGEAIGRLLSLEDGEYEVPEDKEFKILGDGTFILYWRKDYETLGKERLGIFKPLKIIKSEGRVCVIGKMRKINEFPRNDTIAWIFPVDSLNSTLGVEELSDTGNYRRYNAYGIKTESKIFCMWVTWLVDHLSKVKPKK
ncbi:hypothetical protein ACFL24_01445 [Patescibacteria group bacterium]